MIQRAFGAATVIVEAFLKWSETARVADRAKAANALARAYIRSGMGPDEKRAAMMAMTYLLDDPSPKVRLALAEALSTSSDVPRSIILSLAEDQAEISATVIMNSPVMTDDDFIELAGRGDSFRRSLIASRPQVSRLVSAAIAAVGDEPEIVLLLENRDNQFAAATLRNIARRHGKSSEVRSLLLDQGDLPADVRHLLMQEVSEALSSHDLVRAIIGEGRAARITREANEVGTLLIAGRAEEADIPALVEHLRAGCQLTPAFLMHALCAGRVDFIASVLVNLTGIEDRLMVRASSVVLTGAGAVRANGGDGENGHQNDCAGGTGAGMGGGGGGGGGAVRLTALVSATVLQATAMPGPGVRAHGGGGGFCGATSQDYAAGEGGNGRVSIVAPMVMGASFPAHTTD